MASLKPRIVGINHIALEVGDIEEALHFYGHIFSFELRGTHEGKNGRPDMAFIDMGDQFLALTKGRHQPPDRDRHFGLVVDDRSRIRELALQAGAKFIEGPFLDFLDPWGNRIEVLEYSELQFTKAPGVLQGMGLRLDKSDAALKELRDKGLV
ncbi:VOC family protein [Rhizobium sp. RAF56]|uniref:VOC family protein n=1 Tax=Rhizobium sp. RAF56 TaxID=3233062 RepID=UPI003F9906CD